MTQDDVSLMLMIELMIENQTNQSAQLKVNGLTSYHAFPSAHPDTE